MTYSEPNPFLKRLGIALPIIQAPVAGVSTPALAAAVSKAGGLGSLGLGASDAATARRMIGEARAIHDGPLNVNLFCHRPAVADVARETAWVRRFGDEFATFGAVGPTALREIYRSFAVDDDMLAVILDLRPSVVSSHFGLPPAPVIERLRRAGIILMASATSLAEAQMVAAAGLDAVIAQGWDAGGHRGVFGSTPQGGASPGEAGFGAHWAGQGAPLARPMAAAALMDTLARELAQAI